jgi:geranylgeranyl diphosphate synthase type 3
VGTSKCETFVNKEKCFVLSFILTLCITLYCRIDDIQDNSILRRGIPVAHSIYGVASTINAANYVLFIALERVLSLNHSDATMVYTEQLLELHRGQGMEIYWRDNYTCPSVDEYQEMVKRSKNRVIAMSRF